jgi:hypothetical protein
MSEKHEPNELHRELMGVNGLNPWDGHDSSSRRQMFASHIGQTLTILNPGIRRQLTGMEREFGKYTFSVRMPCDAKVIRLIDRYPRTLGQDSIRNNPETILLYEDVHTKEVGMLSLTGHFSNHQYFGFQYVEKEAFRRIQKGAYIPKDAILLDSPAVDDDNNYRFGVECNVAYMTHPAVSEDGILVSRSALKKFSFNTFETRTVEWGSKYFPLNLYGDVKNFKAYPDIGDTIRDDGLLMCLRQYDDDLAVVEQNIHSLMEVDHTFDRSVYAPIGGTIVDIKVFHDRQNDLDDPAFGMDRQSEKYDAARRLFYGEILAEMKKLRKERGDALAITPALQQLNVMALAVMNDDEKQRITKLYRHTPLDDWRITFTIKYTITPTDGFKITDGHGGKGVICHVAEDHEMPVDSDGNVADMIVDPRSISARTNPGRSYEHYVNAASRDVSKNIRKFLNLDQHTPQVHSKVQDIENHNPDLFNKTWNYLLGYYEIVSPKMYRGFLNGYSGTRAHHLAEIVRDGVYLYLPTNNERESVEMVVMLEQSYRPLYGPVTYVGYSGKPVTTRSYVRVASQYILLLEKTADDGMAISSGRRQHFGVLAPISNADKYSQGFREQPVRALGEAEIRIMYSYAGDECTVELLDRNNNPDTHDNMLMNILRADKPTDILNVVDRNVVPLGGSKPLNMVKHIMQCGGIEFVYSPHVPDYT